MPLLDEIAALPDSAARFDHLLARARAAPRWPDIERTDDRLVPGCTARLWVASRLNDGKFYFSCDSESLVVKAIATLVCEVASGHAAEALAQLSPESLRKLGITEHLSANRRNALANVWKFIQHEPLRRP